MKEAQQVEQEAKLAEINYSKSEKEKARKPVCDNTQLSAGINKNVHYRYMALRRGDDETKLEKFVSIISVLCSKQSFNIKFILAVQWFYSFCRFVFFRHLKNWPILNVTQLIARCR